MLTYYIEQLSRLVPRWHKYFYDVSARTKASRKIAYEMHIKWRSFESISGSGHRFSAQYYCAWGHEAAYTNEAGPIISEDGKPRKGAF
jgi:hypothetical protein